MATTASETQVQELFIAYFGRPADPVGLAFYADALDAETTTVADIATSFSTSEEAQSIIELGTDAFLAAVYMQAFSRAYDNATAADGTFWADAINDGSTTKELAMVQILGGAQNSDVLAVSNKVEVAQTYTAEVMAEEKDFSGATATTAAVAVLAAVTASAATVTSGNSAATAAVGNLDTPATGVVGDTSTLTAGVDIIEGTTSNETINGSDITAGDLIIDSNSNDSDVLNLKLSAAQAAAGTITNIEAVNVELDAFAGFAYDAAGTTGATITLSSSKLGFDGNAAVTTGGANTITTGSGVTALIAAITTGKVVAGAEVTTLGVTGVTTGSVDTGSAATASITAAAAGSKPTVTVNGDIALTLATANDVAIVATANSVITLVPGAANKITVTGAGEASFIGSLTGVTITGASAVTHTATTGDISGLGDTVSISAAATALTVKDGQTIALEKSSALTVTGSKATDAITVSTAKDLTSLTFATLKSATVNATAALDIATLALGTTDVTLNVVGDTTVSTAVTGTGDLIITGTGDVGITTGATAVVDASGLTGALTYVSTVAGEITGGSGKNEIETANQDTTVVGGASADSVDASAITNKVIAVTGNAGNDSLVLDQAAGTVVFDGGAGTDTLILADGADIEAAAVTLVSVEAIVVQENNGSDVTATVDASTLSGTSMAVAGEDTNNSGDELGLTVIVDQATVNLGGLSLDNVDTVTIDASAFASAVAITGTSAEDTITTSAHGDTVNAGAEDDTIIGGAGADTINGGTGDDTITSAGGKDVISGGAGDDTFTLTSTEASMDSITDYQAAVATSDNDTLTVSVAVVAASIGAKDVTGVVTGDTGALTASTDANGILTLSGLSADTGAVDTLSEWIAIADHVSTDNTANVLAFEFNGNTYVYEDAIGNTEVMTVELTGLTGITAVSISAVADGIFIA